MMSKEPLELSEMKNHVLWHATRQSEGALPLSSMNLRY